MRITIVQGAFLPVPPVLGGAVEKVWFALGKEFVRRGHQVTHVSRQYGTFTHEELIDSVHHLRIPGFDTPRSLVRLKWYDLRYSRRALKVLPKADVLVTNVFWLPLLSPAAALGKIYVHVARYPKGQMKFYDKAARLQTVSSVIRNAISAQAPKLAARVKVIPNFVPRVDPASAKSQRQQSILYVGRMHPEKGIDLLLDAFVRLSSGGLRDWKLSMVGPWEVKHGGGGESYFNSLRKRTQKLGDRVDWVGPVFDAEALSVYYRQSTLFVYPSLAEHGEALPLAPLEAMAEGCPPVVSSLECFRDYIKPGCNGWTFDHRGDAVAHLAQVLKSVITDPGTLPRFRECALETAQEFSLAKVADQFLSDFEEIVRQ